MVSLFMLKLRELQVISFEEFRDAVGIVGD